MIRNSNQFLILKWKRTRIKQNTILLCCGILFFSLSGYTRFNCSSLRWNRKQNKLFNGIFFIFGFDYWNERRHRLIVNELSNCLNKLTRVPLDFWSNIKYEHSVRIIHSIDKKCWFIILNFLKYSCLSQIVMETTHRFSSNQYQSIDENV